MCISFVILMHKEAHIAHLRQQFHNSKYVIFQEKLLKILKCYNFLWVQRRHDCFPAASFANCFMTLYLLKVLLQTFLSIPVTQKCQILSCDTLVANERYIAIPHVCRFLIFWKLCLSIIGLLRYPIYNLDCNM